MTFARRPHEKRHMMVVSHTHWDREWYLAYQSFRVRLVGLFDTLLDLFDADPDYKHFMLDGHTIPLEDYLEVRPDRFDDLERAVSQGKLLIGPWYIIPDCFLPGGEALVRNFLRGHRVARQFGPVMKVGYIPDPFGQIAHMPQLLRGFGIEYATMWRGADDSLKTTEFVWVAPDGSEVLTAHKPRGYGVGGSLPRAKPALMARLRQIRDDLEPLATTPYLLVMNGGDHVPPQTELSSIIRVANAEMDDAELVHASLPEFFDRVRDAIGDRIGEWPRHEGEFRSGQRAHLLPGVLSARMWIKQANQECEDLLAHWAEPFSTWADMLKQEVGPEWREPLPPTTAHMPFPTSPESISALIDRAWRHLLENQPHDSICGCSVDAVHDEMRQRYDWVREIGEEIVRQSLRTIGALGPDDPLGTVAVFNPTPQPATGWVETAIPWDDARPIAELAPPEGERAAVTLVGDIQRFAIPEGAPPGYDRSRAEIGFVARDVPGYGFRIYRLVPAGPTATGASPARASSDDGRVIENALFRVEASATDGTLTVTDKRAGRTLSGLHRFVDGGDRGDEYNYCAPEHDRLIDRPHEAPRIRREVRPGQQRLVIEQTYRLPVRLSDDRAARAGETCDERIVSTVTLTDGVPRIDIHTVVENAAEDHRLRVHFPSGLRARVSKADEHFGVVERPLQLPAYDDTWAEEPVGTYPQKAFVSVDDGEHGLTVANRGLPEYEVLETRDGAEIALTLLRCVGWLSRGDLTSRKGPAGPQLRTPGAQMPGAWAFDYAIIPHAGDWSAADAHVTAVQHVRPMRARWNRRGLGHLDWEAQLLRVSSHSFAVSAIKRAEDADGVVVRLYNIRDAAAETNVDVPDARGRVTIVDLNEQHLADVVRDEDEGVGITARRNEIVTLRFRR
jgi:mannosylglycerate hydrolase